MSHSDAMARSSSGPFDPRILTRPDRRLLKYYAIIAVFSGPAYPLVFLPLFFKYETLEYKFDDEGVSMRWGILFRREVYLTYRRIQDIHLTRNLIQRWLGLATVSVQTASGSALPEMAIEGIPQAEELRDYFYSKMRGGRRPSEHSAGSGPATDSGSAAPLTSTASGGSGAHDVEVRQLLREIRDSLRTAADRWEARS